MNMRTKFVIVAIVGLGITMPVRLGMAADIVDFETQVLPIFQAHCGSCHMKGKQKGGLSLKSRRSAFRPADSGDVAISPGKADTSRLIERLTSDDPKLRMPKDTDPLSPKHIATLKTWINQGARWPDDGSSIHWAYVAPTRPNLPTTKLTDWTKNEIDAFILAKLESEGLTPSQPVDRAKLLRRVYLTLIGLPPTFQETQAFLADTSDDAYEKVVDGLLQSPRYGERWARQWLDLARYADSNGFQADQLRDSWAYRDWVINAFNAGMGFDQFTIEQIAGDLMPNATFDQKVATGFHRTPTCNVEAGVHPEENRTNQIFDRVNTTGLVFMGTSLECAQCHNHKYDPFTMQDYYQLFAFFNNTPLEVEGNGGVQFSFYGPKMDLPMEPKKVAKRKAIEVEIAELKATESKMVAQAKKQQAEWEKSLVTENAKTAEWHAMTINSFVANGKETYTTLDDGSILIGGDIPNGNTTYQITASTTVDRITGFKVEALTHDSLPSSGPGRGNGDRPNIILNEFKVSVGDKPIKFTGAKADFAQRGWDAKNAIDGNLKTGWAISPQFGKPHWVRFLTTTPLNVEPGTAIRFSLIQNYGGGRVIGRVRLQAMTGTAGDSSVPDGIVAIAKKAKRSKKEIKEIDTYYLDQVSGVKSVRDQIKKKEDELKRIKPPSTLIMVEMDKSRDTHILVRGNYLNPGKKVGYGTPASLHGWDESWPKNRLGLAKWLVHRDNPLVARVTVNRWWAEFMGNGIVQSQEDFGTQSDPPSHPKLLDWLAVEFMDNGWSMKHIHKLIAMSAAFQQSSSVTPELLEADPSNRLLARGPRFRMSAEMVRDNALQISGLLNTKMAGPPVFPPQPPGLWRQTGRNEPKYVVATNEDRYRRGIYVIWRRAAPYPSFVNFDGPDRSACHPSRSRTNTPLQALTLLNDEAYVEMALSLGQQIAMSEAPDTQAKIRYGIRRTLTREASDEEVQLLSEMYKEEFVRLKQQPASVNALLSAVSTFKPAASVDKAELAAWFFIANVLLNLDETINIG